MKQQFFKTKFGDQMIRLGLSSLAVLAVVAEGASRILLSFPDRRTSIHRVLRNLDNQHSSSFDEHFSALKDMSGYNLSVILHRLKAKGLVEKVKNKEYRSTHKGKLFLESVLKSSHKNKPKWDGKWRLITFDIPEKFRKERDWLRYHLLLAHYKMLHKSVFVGKFPLDDEIYKELYRKHLNQYIRFLTVGEIDEGSFD